MKDRAATCGYVVFLCNVETSKPGRFSASDLRWAELSLRLSAAWHATRILSSPPSLRRAASSAISVKSHRRSSLEDLPCSIMRVRSRILVVIEVIDEERTASSSRRSAKLRERSRGNESKVWVYSERRAREYAVVRLELLGGGLAMFLVGAMTLFVVGCGGLGVVGDDQKLKRPF